MKRTESVRGRIAVAIRPIGMFVETENGEQPFIVVDGQKPSILITVKTGAEWVERARREGKRVRHGWYERDFYHQCERYGAECRIVQDNDGYTCVYEVCALAEALDAITERDCVLEWCPIINVRVPYTGQGQGAEKKTFVDQIDDGSAAKHPSVLRMIRNIRAQAIMQELGEEM